MNLDGILKLAEMGFTKEDIMKLATAEQKNNVKEEKPKEEEKKEEKVEEHKEEAKINDTLEDKFNKLMEKLDAANFLNARQPNEETVDDIIANIINPKD